MSLSVGPTPLPLPASKRGSADEASKLRDIVLKPKELSQPQK